MSKSTNLLIERFVDVMNKKGFEPRSCEQVPSDLRIRGSAREGICKWQIRGVQATPWLSTVYRQLPKPLPDSFLSLVTRYTFLDFEVGPLHLFANTGLDINEEFSTTIFRDKALTETLTPAGFIQFARVPGGANYDPICFDTNATVKAREWPIVQIDHEEILCNSRLKVVSKLGPSFRVLIEEVVNQ